MTALASPLRPSRFLAPLILAISLLILGGFLGDLLLSRSHELEAGRQRVTHLTALISEHTARSLESVDILLRELAGDLSGNNRWESWSPETGFTYLSTRHTRSLPQLRDLAIFDRQGYQIFTSTQFPATRINVIDRPYFTSLERGADFAMYGPYIGRNSGRYTYALVRRLKNSRQEFNGAVFAAIEPAYFQDFCWSVRLSDDFESVLVNTQGRIVASCRPTDLSQQSPMIGANVSDVLANGALRQRPNADTPDRRDGWIVIEANVSGFPDLRVLTLVPESALLQHWYRRARDFGILAALCLGVLLLGGWLLYQRRREQEVHNRQLSQEREALETQLHESAWRLEQQKTEAERANAAKSRFLAAASHDLRQPLHALALFASDLQRQIRLQRNEHLPQLAQQIQSSTEVLSELLDSLLDLSRLDVAGITPQLRHHPVKEVFDRLGTTFDRAALAKGLNLRLRDRGLHVYSDAALLERLLANLVSNAIRYTDKGGILVSARRRNGAVLVEVRDTGIGIPAEHQQAIFVEFYQINNAARESHKGLGLGLSIVDRLARALGVRIELISQLGRGTCFRFSLPLGDAGERKVSPGNLPSPSSISPRICVLGNGEALGEATTLIRNWGYPVTLGYQADQPPQILLTTANEAEPRAREYPSLPLVVLCAGEENAPPAAHKLVLPLRPARLRALLRRLEEEITA